MSVSVEDIKRGYDLSPGQNGSFSAPKAILGWEKYGSNRAVRVLHLTGHDKPC